MNENTARELALVRAIETADQSHAILSLEDRRYASRSGRELAQWQANETGVAPTAEQFLQQRASLLLKRISQRTPAFGAVTRGPHLLQLMLILLPVAALLLGVLLDRITDPHRVDLLSAPLLLIVLWNLTVYAGMLVWRWIDVPALRLPALQRAMAAFTARIAGGGTSARGKMPASLRSAALAFMLDWTRLGAPLARARITRAVHLGAAMFATGALLSLYARGLLSQYGAGWESTFLDAQQVQSILSLVFAPAQFVFQLPAFTVAEVEALRFAPTSLMAATSLAPAGARWVHLYAATLLLLVIVPRLLLGAVAHWQARRLYRNFPLSLEQPYFRRLTAEFLGSKPGVLRVLPYSFTVSEAQDQGLAAIAIMLLGEQAHVMLRPSAAYGETPAAPVADPSATAAATLTAVLFSLAATPESQNHGVFLAYAALSAGQPIAVLIDESSFLERLGSQAGGTERIAERIALWQEFCRFHHCSATIVNLSAPQTHRLDLGAGPILSESA